MTTDNDIIIDEIYQDVGIQLNDAFDAIVEGIMDSNNISPEMMIKILEIWFFQSNDHLEVKHLKKEVKNAS
tara:strand:+ start:1993 stop:2205 length:213 start_codon:yes stop_codon:yes gene_type:complete